MRLLYLLPLITFLSFSCINNAIHNNQATAASVVIREKPATKDTFNLIREFPLIQDTSAFITQLRQACQLEEHESPEQKQLQKISYYKEVLINGSDEPYIFLEYDYGDGAMASYPWKYQLLFTRDGHLITTFSAQRFQWLPVFPNQAPFLLMVVATGKGNGGHELYRMHGDTLENVYEGYYDGSLSTYDAHEDRSIFEPNELNISVLDINKDGFNDLKFWGNLVLIQGRTADGIWYDNVNENGKTISYSASNPFKKIPLEYIFFYDSSTGHFKAKEDYEAKYKPYR